MSDQEKSPPALSISVEMITDGRPSQAFPTHIADDVSIAERDAIS
jgi:hypothetical protein